MFTCQSLLIFGTVHIKISDGSVTGNKKNTGV